LVLVGVGAVLLKTQPVVAGTQRDDDVVVPVVVVTCTEVGLPAQGHQAKYQPFSTVAVTVGLFVNVNLTADTPRPVLPNA
jgi:hypothetical protein